MNSPGETKAGRRAGRWLGIAAACLLVLPAGQASTEQPGPSTVTAPDAPPGGVIGLVLTDWRHALQETPQKSECPAGLQVSERKQLEAMKSPKQQLNDFGGYYYRGPNGEFGAYAPDMVPDPLPIPQLETKAGYGLNLDGTTDGKATAKTCTHEKFHDADGQAVDNQLSRVVGCTEGWRTGGFQSEFWSREFKSSALNRILIEISGVDDMRNDPSVEVAIYKGLDGLTPAGTNAYLPYTNQRIDTRFPRFTHKTHGRIVDGVLYTDPIPVANFAVFWVNHAGERRMRDVQLRLKLKPDGAEGIIGGYEDLKIWWILHSGGISAAGANVGKFSNSAYWRDAHRYADGYPDPKSGQCTAISAGYKVTAVRALISHPGGPGQMASAAK